LLYVLFKKEGHYTYDLSPSISAAYLIGGTDQKTEGHWEWADGTSFKFTDWGPGQPDNFINAEDCLTYYRQTFYSLDDSNICGGHV
jgi:hypothetical protein